MKFDNNNFIIVGGGLENKGAAAMSMTVITQLMSRYPDASFTLLTEDKSTDGDKEYTFQILHWREKDIKNIALFNKINDENKKIIDILKKGTAIFDVSGYAIGSNWGIRRSVIYLLVIKIAKIYDIPMYLLPQSYGPFDYKFPYKTFMKFLIRYYLNYPRKIYVRELWSKALLTNIGNRNAILSNDIVLLSKIIDFCKVKREEELVRKISLTQSCIGIIPNVRNEKFIKAEKMIELYQDIVMNMISLGYTVYFLAHSDEDRDFCENIISFIDVGNCLDVYGIYDLTLYEYSNVVNKMEFLVASRYHSIINAYKVGTPCLAIGWAEKYKELLSLYKSDQFFFDVRKGITSGEIINKLLEIHKDSARFKMMIQDITNQIQHNNIFKEIVEDYEFCKANNR